MSYKVLLDRRVDDPAAALAGNRFLDTFTGTDGTQLDAHNADTPGGTSYLDLSSGAELLGTALASGRVGLKSAVVYNTAEVAFAVGDEVFADIERANVLENSAHAFGIIFCGATAGPLDDYYLVWAQRVDDNTVSLKLQNAFAESAQTIAASVAWALGSSLRLGVTLTSATSFAVWTEPNGGGTRTQQGTFTTASTSLIDAAHPFVGLYNNNPGMTSYSAYFDNLTVKASVDATDFTLPYAVAVDGSEGVVEVVDNVTGEVLTSTRPTTTTVRVSGDYTAVSVSVGLRYTFEGQLSTLYLRTADYTGIPQADTRKRLQLQRLRALHQDTYKYDILVQGSERSETSSQFNSTTPSDGSKTAPVLSNNELVTLKIQSLYPKPVWITGLEWEGIFKARTALR